MVTAVNGVMGVIDPDGTPTSAVNQKLSRKYLHPTTRSYVASTRSKTQPSHGRIRGHSGRGIHVEFYSRTAPNSPLISAQHLTSDQAGKKIKDIDAVNGKHA